ncbi:hypothetical protein [Streptomyces sp. NPDC087270]|uniref:hypothetical protein n=1 Tax=Streptomyces sp. NPDC087270 TaxID=3365774 RepID=UPI00381FF9E7
MCTAAVLTAAAVLGGTVAADTAGAATGARSGEGPAPSPSELKAALLTPGDTGLSGADSTGGGGGVGGDGISGCPALVKVLEAPPGAGTQEADFSGGQTGPLLSEELTAGTSAKEGAVYARAKAALTSCRDLTLTEGGTRLALTLKPIRFGGGESTATRMEGKLSGVQVNGYMAFGRVGPVLVGYTFFQIAGDSPQLASALYQKAVDKVRHTVSTGGGTPV